MGSRLVVRGALALTALSLWLAACAPAQAAGKGDRAKKGAEEEEQPELSGVSLGEYFLREVRVAEGAKVRLSFELFAEIDKELADKIGELVERHQGRIRDQVLTTVRMSSLADFREPDLRTLRRRLKMRLKRFVPWLVTERILFSDYEYLPE